MENQEKNNQTYGKFVEENFIVKRKKGKYSPLYFIPKDSSKYHEVFKVGDFNEEKARTDYRREVVPIPLAEFYEETGFEIVEKNKGEFIHALVDYLNNNRKL